MTDKRVGAEDDTAIAPPRGDTTPVPRVAMGSAAIPESEMTRPSDPVIPTSSSGERTIRAGTGKAEDYPALLPVDPRHYVREEEIARGGMGRIVAAHDRRLGRRVAIKELLAPSDALRVRFEREARITARLQHPASIGVLEAGTWPTGDLFYTMNLVAGKSLDKVIAAQPSIEARFGLVSHIIAVADTLAYAHNRRIIHRDLKPANVLIGDFGETVVIDWGLAKDLADPTSDVTAGPYRSGSASSGTDTEVGSVIGTPAYMPPEQAQGLAVDERADVYALGAMLYHVLAGVAPYTGATAAAVLDAVANEPPRPLLDVAPRTPPDLAAIVHKAMARDGKDRYASAKELATELKKFQTGQLVGAHRYTAGELFRRWLRRYRAAVGVGVVAVVVLAVIAVLGVQRIVRERERADAARALAVTRSNDANELMSFMLGDLKDKLTPLGKVDVLETVARKAVGYYESRSDDERDVDTGKRAAGLSNIGDVLVVKADFAQALAVVEEARRLADGLATKNPGDPQWPLAVAQYDMQIGTVYFAQGDLEKARDADRRALPALQHEAATNDGARRSLGMAQRQLGDVLLELGDTKGAAEQFRSVIALATAELAQAPDDRRWKRLLAVNHSQLGGVLLQQGELDASIAESHEDVALSEALAASDPKNTEAQNDVAGAHSRLGDVWRAKGDNAKALVEFRAALATMKVLADRDPGNADWQHDLGVSHDRVGNVLLDLGDKTGALAAYQEGLAVKRRIYERDPSNREGQRNFALSFNKIGNVWDVSGKPAQALGEYRQGLGIIETLARAEPTNAGWQRDLAVSDYLVADALLATGEPEAALVSHRASLAIVKQLIVRDPKNVIWQGDVVDGHTQVGKVLMALKRPDEARAEYEAALAIADQQAALDPKEPSWADQAKKLRETLAKCCAK